MQIDQIILVLVDTIFQILWICLFARIILSWFPHKRTFISNFLEDITDPMLEPIKRVLPSFGGIDFSPIVAFFVLRLAHMLILSLIISISPNFS